MSVRCAKFVVFICELTFGWFVWWTGGSIDLTAVLGGDWNVKFWRSWSCIVCWSWSWNSVVKVRSNFCVHPSELAPPAISRDQINVLMDLSSRILSIIHTCIVGNGASAIPTRPRLETQNLVLHYEASSLSAIIYSLTDTSFQIPSKRTITHYSNF